MAGFLSAPAADIASSRFLEDTVAAPTPTVLRAARASGSDKYLQDSSGQLTDSGSPNFRYDGSASSDELTLDATKRDGTALVAGDPVGPPWVHCSVTGREVPGSSVVGLPSDTRDGGIQGSGSEYVRIQGTWETVRVRFSSAFDQTGDVIVDAPSDGWYLICQSSSNRILGRYYDGGSAVGNSGFITALTAGKVYDMWMSYDTAGGGRSWALYDGSTLVNSSSNGSSAPTSGTDDWRIHGTQSGTSAEIQEIALYTGFMTLAEIAAEVSGTPAPDHVIVGLRTGINRASLVYEGGSNTSVQAVEV